jgi:hypothetical protein
VTADVVEVPPAGPTKSTWSFNTNSEPIGVNVAVVEPGAIRLKITPLLKLSDTWAAPEPVVLPARDKNASLMRSGGIAETL